MHIHPTLAILFYLPLLSYFTLSSATDFPPCNDHDKAVLLRIKDHFGGPKSRLDWDNSTDCCSDWSYVACSTLSGNAYGRIDTVTFSRGWGLSGTIPSDLGNLPYLSLISIAENVNLTGPIPKALTKLKKLFHLDLAMNNLSGPISGDLLGLKTLLDIDLSGNKFSGEILKSVSSLPILWQFNVSHNELTGNLPKFPSSLKSFDVSYNQLCGKIPKGVIRFGLKNFEHNKCLCGPPLATPCK